MESIGLLCANRFPKETCSVAVTADVGRGWSMRLSGAKGNSSDFPTATDTRLAKSEFQRFSL
jgi:hypothetical protein